MLALAPTSHLLTVYRLLHTPIYLQTFGAGPLHAEVLLQLNLYQYGWGLVIFGIHLVLLGYLVCRSRYIPRVIGVLLVMVGLVWIVIPPQPYLYPSLKLGLLLPVSAIELLLPLWLLIRGWKIQEPLRPL